MAEVLRYPYEAITDSTDYLQITISAYTPAGNELIRTNTLNNSPAENVGRNPSRSENPYTQTLKKAGGVILLPMPSNIQDGNSVSYADDSLDTLTGKLFGGSTKIMGTELDSAGFDKFYKTLGNNALDAAKEVIEMPGLKKIAMKSLAAQATSVFGGNVTLNQVLARESGQILNPNMELLFNGVTLRTFRFSFKMTPRDATESQQIKYIIRSLKRNMAAKSDTTFLNAPNIFELRYRQGNIDHPFLHKFKPCALTDMAVNYTGENVYATYGDGTPVSMTMDLTFKELVPIYDNDYVDSDSTVGY